MSVQQTSVPGFRGPVSDLEVLPDGDPTLPAGPDLLAMADEALGYLARNPLPEHGYQCRFSFFLLNCPPFIDQGRTRELLDPIAIGDTESRNDIAFNQMREMCGSNLGLEPQHRVHERLVGYLRNGKGAMGDDTCWVVPYCGSSDHDGTYSLSWTTGKLLYSEVDLFRQTGDPSHLELARRIFHGIRRMASWDTGRAFYPRGWQPWREDRYARGYEGHYPHVIGPVLHYWRTTGDPEALEFVLAMAEGMVADLQPVHHHQPDGSVRGHNHVQMHSVRMMAELCDEPARYGLAARRFGACQPQQPLRNLSDRGHDGNRDLAGPCRLARVLGPGGQNRQKLPRTRSVPAHGRVRIPVARRQ